MGGGGVENQTPKYGKSQTMRESLPNVSRMPDFRRNVPGSCLCAGQCCVRVYDLMFVTVDFTLSIHLRPVHLITWRGIVVWASKNARQAFEALDGDSHSLGAVYVAFIHSHDAVHRVHMPANNENAQEMCRRTMRRARETSVLRLNPIKSRKQKTVVCTFTDSHHERSRLCAVRPAAVPLQSQ